MEPDFLESNLSILIIGYDPYSDVWHYFDYFFQKNAGKLKCYSIFSSVNNPFVGASSIHAVTTKGDSGFSPRMLAGLKLIKTKYTLLLLEDYILSKPVDVNALSTVVHEMDKYDYSFCEIQNFMRTPKRVHTKKSGLIREMVTPQHYRVSMQPAIWETSFLRELCAQPIVRPWDFEILLEHSYNAMPLGEYPKAGAALCRAFEVTNFIDKGCITQAAKKLIKKNHLPSPSRRIQTPWEDFQKKSYNFASNILPSFLRRFVKRLGKKKEKVYYTDD
jgi:hypothetical protein